MMEVHIDEIKARKVLDSRGAVTVEVEVSAGGFTGMCSAPSGASTGKTEVVSFPKGGADSSLEFLQKKLASKLLGLNIFDQKLIDTTLMEVDGTKNFANAGGNLATAISIASAKTASYLLGMPMYRYVGGAFSDKLPRPMGNVIGGGKHSMNGTTIQEFLVSGQGKDFFESMLINARVHHRIGELLSEKFPKESIGLGDEKAWTANVSDLEAVEIVKSAANEISSEFKRPVLLGTDFAASSFYEKGKYVYKKGVKSRDEQIDFAKSFSKEFGFYYIEDPLDETDFEGFAEITKGVGSKSLIVGDDLYTTNPDRIRKGAKLHSTNCVLIKVNQIGTLSKTAEAVKVASDAGMETTVSHRSGETTDDFIAHLAVAFSSKFIKTGTIGGERLSKLNELVRIEEDLSSS